MRQHADLSAMMGFVGQHVAEHLNANRPGLSPAIPEKLFDTAASVKRFCEHLGTASATFGQRCAGLLLGAVRATELLRNFQVRGRQPDPLTANIVYVREDGGDAADFAGRFRCPCVAVETLDDRLIHAIVDREDARCRTAELRGDLGLTRGHESLLPAP